MPAEKKIPNRDETLVKVLERLAVQIEHINIRMEEIEKRQRELFISAERADTRRNETAAQLDDLKHAFAQAHAEMTGIAYDQEGAGNEMKAVVNRQEAIANRQASMVNTQEIMNQNLDQLKSRFDIQEKTARDHLAFSYKHEEKIDGKMAELTHHVTESHVKTEKNLSEHHLETRRKLDEARLETMRRLLAFDGVEASLHELLRRTEPPEPLWVVRQFRKLREYIRARLSMLKNRIKLWAEGKKSRDKGNSFRLVKTKKNEIPIEIPIEIPEEIPEEIPGEYAAANIVSPSGGGNDE